jgi:P27 family predicted phage terminase small subunit
MSKMNVIPITKPSAGPPKAPKNLPAEGRKLWDRLVGEFELDDEGSQVLLRVAVEAYCRMRQAAAILDKEGLVSIDRFGQTRAHPATLIERDSRAAFVATVKSLHLPLGAAGPPRIGRPPGIPLARKGR